MFSSYNGTLLLHHPQLGDTLLHIAINTGNCEIIEYLVNEHSLDVNARNAVSAPRSIIIA